MMVTGPQKNSTVENLNSVTLKVDSENFKCYSVTASNDSFTVIVEETLSVDMGKFGIFNEDLPQRAMIIIYTNMSISTM